ncbi:hypothetical protein D3C73_1052690 [compost metagenome]
MIEIDPPLPVREPHPDAGIGVQIDLGAVGEPDHALLADIGRKRAPSAPQPRSCDEEQGGRARQPPDQDGPSAQAAAAGAMTRAVERLRDRRIGAQVLALAPDAIDPAIGIGVAGF